MFGSFNCMLCSWVQSWFCQTHRVVLLGVTWCRMCGKLCMFCLKWLLAHKYTLCPKNTNQNQTLSSFFPDFLFRFLPFLPCFFPILYLPFLSLCFSFSPSRSLLPSIFLFPVFFPYTLTHPFCLTRAGVWMGSVVRCSSSGSWCSPATKRLAMHFGLE